MKIIVAHEGKQHSYKTAEMLYKKGILFKYITTVYDRPYSLTRLIKFFLRGNAKKKCSSRRTNVLPDSIIKQLEEWKGLLLLFLSRVRFFKKIIPHYYNWLHDGFGKKVARYAIKNNVDAVIMYDGNCNKCWEILKEKAPHIKRIMDISIANRLLMKEIYLADMEQTKDIHLKEEQRHLWIPDNIKRYIQEIQDTHYFIAGSDFVRRSLLYSNIDKNQISVVPYGVDIEKFNYIPKKEIETPLKLLFVGQVVYRKGIHHLLNVISQFSSEEVELFLIGGYNVSSPLYQQYKDINNIHFLGFITRDVLAEYFQNADVFVLPSLAEGFALVSLEALACGLPVICTENSGCNDAITDFENGFVIKAGDNVALKEKIQWFVDNKDVLPEMSENSRKTAEYYTWSRYYEGVIGALTKFLRE